MSAAYWIAVRAARAAGLGRTRPPIDAADRLPEDEPDAPTSCVACGADCTDRVCCSSASYLRTEIELGERFSVVVHDDPTCPECCGCSARWLARVPSDLGR